MPTGKTHYDAVIVGSGPNGLSAAITLARAGFSVKLFEAKRTLGGGMRSAELTLPGFLHDICSAVYPMAPLSQFFRSLPPDALTLKWIQPLAAIAHPLDDEGAAILDGLGLGLSANLERDIPVWQELFKPWLACGADLFRDLFSPLSLLPRFPLAMARFGYYGMQSADAFSRHYLRTNAGKALFAGIAAHSLLPFNRGFSTAPALALALAAHLNGWPIVAGGSQRITDALATYLLSLGAEIQTEAPITSLDELPAARVIMLDVSAKQFARLAADKLPSSYASMLAKFRTGPGICKVDWALSEPVPWRDKNCLQAGTVHVGGEYTEIAASESALEQDKIPEKPFVLLSQPSLFDPQRCPPGKHVLWGYCHVPFGCNVDMSASIEAQIERFAPGFRDCILARSIRTAMELESYNPNYAGGDISAGAMDWPQIFRRPTSWFHPYRTPLQGVFLCSASTPPGPGVHGMCGYHAANAAMKEYFL